MLLGICVRLSGSIVENLLWKSVCLNNVATRPRLYVCWCMLHQKRVKIKSAVIMMTFLLNCNIGCKKRIAGRAMYHLDFQKHLCRNVLRANGSIDLK